MNFRNFPIVTKLGIGFGAVLLIVALSAGTLVWQVSSLADIERANSRADHVTNLIDQLAGDAASIRAAAYKVVISGAETDVSSYREARAEFDKDIAEAEGLLAKMDGQLLDQLRDLKSVAVAGYIDRFLETQIKFALDPATRAAATASVVSSDSVRARKAYEAKVDSIRDAVTKWSEVYEAQAEQAMSQTQIVVIGSGVLSLLIGTGMAWLIARAIGGPLGSMTSTMQALARGDNGVAVPARDQTDEIGQMAGAVQVFKEAAIEKLRLEAEAAEARRLAQVERERVEAEKAVAARQQAQVVDNIATGLTKLAAGDLLQRIEQPFAAEYEGLRRDFNEAVVQLQRTIKEVSLSSGTIRSGTGEISTASDDLSRRTEQQAANLEETAAALAEITGAMKRSAEGAQHAREVVGVAQVTADKSSEVIGRTVEAMTRIDQASRQISNIIGVIDEIAFQTNLLALNAGVEAARAGESGRGFAVVASEVRGLAQRCAEAAKEVKTLVRSSEEQVKAGVELVGASGTMLSQIVGQVGELRTIVTGIAASAETQAAGISEVNIAIAQLDQVTQQNAAMAEEATAAARNLAKEGSELLRLVGHFSTGAVMAAAPVEAPAAAKPTPHAPRPAGAMPAKRVAAGGGGAVAAATSEDWQEF